MDNEIILRLATLEDMWDIYNLANSLEARSASFNQQKISRNEHETWFRQKLDDIGSIVYVITNNMNDNIGMLRYDVSKSKIFTLSVIINKKFRGRGVGTRAIVKGTDLILNKYPDYIIEAYSLDSNIASKKSLLKSGFTEIGKKDIKSKIFIKFVRSLIL